ncbi:MAG: DUF6588 family protein [Rhodothermales bacterium]
MRIGPFLLIALLCSASLLPNDTEAQDLGELVDGVGRSYAELYMQPLADGLGADLNSGLFHTARIGGGLLPLVDLYVGAKVMGALVTDADKTFDLSYRTEQVFRASDGRRYTVPVTFEIANGPTVFGRREPGTATVSINETVSNGPDGVRGTSDDVVIDTTATFDVLPGLIDTPVAPLIVPQFGFGSIAGTDLVVRYLPRIGHDEFGSIGLIGVGVRHSISQYLPLLPVNVTGQFMWQKLSIENQADDEIFSASAWAANIAASRRLLILTVYGGLQMEGSSVDIDYTFEPEDPDLPSQSVAFDLTGDNTFRVLGGIALGLGPIVINADAAVGQRSVFSAGVGLSL